MAEYCIIRKSAGAQKFFRFPETVSQILRLMAIAAHRNQFSSKFPVAAKHIRFRVCPAKGTENRRYSPPGQFLSPAEAQNSVYFIRILPIGINLRILPVPDHIIQMAPALNGRRVRQKPVGQPEIFPEHLLVPVFAEKLPVVGIFPVDQVNGSDDEIKRDISSDTPPALRADAP